MNWHVVNKIVSEKWQQKTSSWINRKSFTIMHFISIWDEVELNCSCHTYWVARRHFLCALSRMMTFKNIFCTSSAWKDCSKTWTNFTSKRPTQMHDSALQWWVWALVNVECRQKLPHKNVCACDGLMNVVCWRFYGQFLRCEFAI